MIYVKSWSKPSPLDTWYILTRFPQQWQCLKLGRPGPSDNDDGDHDDGDDQDNQDSDLDEVQVDSVTNDKNMKGKKEILKKCRRDIIEISKKY